MVFRGRAFASVWRGRAGPPHIAARCRRPAAGEKKKKKMTRAGDFWGRRRQRARHEARRREASCRAGGREGVGAVTQPGVWHRQLVPGTSTGAHGMPAAQPRRLPQEPSSLECVRAGSPCCGQPTRPPLPPCPAAAAASNGDAAHVGSYSSTGRMWAASQGMPARCAQVSGEGRVAAAAGSASAGRQAATPVHRRAAPCRRACHRASGGRGGPSPHRGLDGLPSAARVGAAGGGGAPFPAARHERRIGRPPPLPSCPPQGRGFCVRPASAGRHTRVAPCAWRQCRRTWQGASQRGRAYWACR